MRRSRSKHPCFRYGKTRAQNATHRRRTISGAELAWLDASAETVTAEKSPHAPIPPPPHPFWHETASGAAMPLKKAMTAKSTDRVAVPVGQGRRAEPAISIARCPANHPAGSMAPQATGSVTCAGTPGSDCTVSGKSASAGTPWINTTRLPHVCSRLVICAASQESSLLTADHVGFISFPAFSNLKSVRQSSLRYGRTTKI